jgi:hypothetical protein
MAPIREDDVINKVAAFHADLKRLHDFTSQRLLPALDARLKQTEPSLKEAALRDTFVRIYLVVGSIIKLNHYKDFHVLASVVRTLFELYLDMHLLDREIVADGFERFREFTGAKKFSTAKSRRNWAMQVKYPFDEKFPARTKYLQQVETQKVAERIQNLWDAEGLPSHWSGLTMPDRAAKLGEEFIEMFILLYDLGNWYTHSGPLDWQLLEDGKNTNTIAGLVYAGAFEMFRDSCNICIKAFSLNIAND